MDTRPRNCIQTRRPVFQVLLWVGRDVWFTDVRARDALRVALVEILAKCSFSFLLRYLEGVRHERGKKLKSIYRRICCSRNEPKAKPAWDVGAFPSHPVIVVPGMGCFNCKPFRVLHLFRQQAEICIVRQGSLPQLSVSFIPRLAVNRTAFSGIRRVSVLFLIKIQA